MSVELKTKPERRQVKRERLINDAPRTLREATWPVGSVAHQGDLILVRIKELPAGAKPRGNRQLADGSTQGSRHILEAGACYDCPAEEVLAAIREVCPKADLGVQYVGPVFATVEGVALLTHPEHGDYHFEGEMVVAVVYQRNLDAEEREARVLD